MAWLKCGNKLQLFIELGACWLPFSAGAGLDGFLSL